MSNPTKEKNEPKRWLDDPQNVKKIIRGFIGFAVGDCGGLDFQCRLAQARDFQTRGKFAHWKPYQPWYLWIPCLCRIGLPFEIDAYWNGKNVLMRDEDCWDSRMNVLAASSLELGTHPATALLLGGLIAAVLRGRYASMTLVIAPILGFWYVSTMEVGSVSYLSLFGYEILGVAVDQQAKLFGYLFTLPPWLPGFTLSTYGILGKYRWHCFMPPVRWGCFAGDMLSLFLWWEGLAITSVFQIWGRKTKAEDSGFRYLFFHVSSGLLLWRYFDPVSW